MGKSNASNWIIHLLSKESVNLEGDRVGFEAMGFYKNNFMMSIRVSVS